MKSVKLVQPVPARVAGGSEKNRNRRIVPARGSDYARGASLYSARDGGLQRHIDRCEISLLTR